MRLEKMAWEHLKEVAPLCGQLGYPVSESELGERFEAVASDLNHRLVVALDGSNRVVAWGHGKLFRALVVAQRMEIIALVVDEAVRSRGLGARLVGELEEWGRAQGCRTGRVASRVVRERAHAFYERLGYRREKTSHIFIKTL